jgi:hypothetical protein
MSGSALQWLTFVAALVAAVGSLIRVWQNQRLWNWYLRKQEDKKALST